MSISISISTPVQQVRCGAGGEVRAYLAGGRDSPPPVPPVPIFVAYRFLLLVFYIYLFILFYVQYNTILFLFLSSV